MEAAAMKLPSFEVAGPFYEDLITESRKISVTSASTMIPAQAITASSTEDLVSSVRRRRFGVRQGSASSRVLYGGRDAVTGQPRRFNHFIFGGGLYIVGTSDVVQPLAEERIVPSLVATTSIGSDPGLSLELYTDDVPTRFFASAPSRRVLSEAKLSLAALPRRAPMPVIEDFPDDV
jgi:hypothetical protein